jgi:hypothetical protein
MSGQLHSPEDRKLLGPAGRLDAVEKREIFCLYQVLTCGALVVQPAA